MDTFYTPSDKSDINIPDVLAYIREHSLFFTAKNRLYVYNDTACYFAHIPRDELPRYVLRFFKEEHRGEVRTSVLNEIVRRLLLMPNAEVNLNERRKSAQHLINLRSGVYSLTDKRLIPRSEITQSQLLEWCFTYCLDFDYVEGADLKDAPVYTEFLKTSLDLDTDKSKSWLLSEIIGVCLSGVQNHRHMYILMGVTGSGKSVIADFLHRIIAPESAVTSFGLQDVSGRFNKQHLENAVLNICREITANRIKDTDTLKELIAEEPIFVEGKGKEGYTAYPHVKLFSCTNQLPRFGNMDSSGNQALLNRMIVLRFNHSIPDENIDRGLVDKLLAERNIICSLAVKSLQRLYDNGFKFTVPEDTKQMLESYHREDISLELFIEQHCRIAEGCMVHNKDFVAAYNRFCMENFFAPYKTREISQFIGANFPTLRCERFKLNGKYLWGWKGITIKEENDYEQEL
ncbi:MAG: phage/plasmid primase, P4 family [Lachnospiraceae bacterium]|nr:phage/plasmid primase, P4 family [Ruminococcus sp.]MCM1276953.1 phage/plasmid primase, P4 family [Lachnospiraceae bacterium]